MSGKIVFTALIVLVCAAYSNAHLYNVTVVLKPGGTDQTGQLTLLLVGIWPDRSIVNLGGNMPLPAGKNQAYGIDNDTPAHEVSAIDFCWFEMDHGDKWNGTLLLEKVIIDPEYLKEKPDDRIKYTQAFCPDPKDFPVKSWNYIDLVHCNV